MLKTVIYQVSVSAAYAKNGYSGLFIQCPTTDELLAAVKTEGESFTDADNLDPEAVEDYKLLADVVRLGDSPDTARLSPGHVDSTIQVRAAGAWVGDITITPKVAYGRCQGAVALVELVA
jgi:hypothetical protein